MAAPPRKTQTYPGKGDLRGRLLAAGAPGKGYLGGRIFSSGASGKGDRQPPGKGDRQYPQVVASGKGNPAPKPVAPKPKPKPAAPKPKPAAPKPTPRPAASKPTAPARKLGALSKTNRDAVAGPRRKK